MSSSFTRQLRRVVLGLHNRSLGKFIRKLETRRDYEEGYGCLVRRVKEGAGIAVQNGNRRILLAGSHENYIRPIVVAFDYFFNTVESVPQDGWQTVDFRKPALFRIRSMKQSFWLSAIAEDDMPFTGYVRHYQPKPGDIVIDAGAYCGVSAYRFASMVGSSGRVIALEPDPANFECLKRNIALHRLNNVIPLQMGLAGVGGEALFLAEGNLGGRMVVNPRGAAKAAAAVRVCSLSELADLTSSPRFDLIKMDIEGAETDVVEGAADWIKDHPVRFAIASYHTFDAGRKLTWQKLEPMFASLGYQCETSFPKHLTTYAWHPSLK